MTTRMCLFALNSVYGCAGIGHALFVVFTAWSHQRTPPLMISLSKEGQVVFQFCIAAYVTIGVVGIALGVLALGLTETSLRTSRGSFLALVVCFVPVAFAVYYYLFARRKLLRALVP